MSDSRKRDLHQFVVGSTGRGGGMRSLRSYAEYWGKEIPEGYKDQQDEFFLASDAYKILNDTQ